jgi:phage terminase large subunit
LYDYFTIKHDVIIGINGSEFIFKGLARDIYSIKSMYDLDYCFVEEAENIDANTWNVLIPTLREEGSEILIAFNPKDKTSETYQRFVEHTPQNAIKIKINYTDVKSFLSQTILDEIEYMRENNYAMYEHVYLGEPLDATEDVIFKGKFEVKEIDIKRYHSHWEYEGRHIEPLYGMDFGFSVDPFASVEIFVLDAHTLYISREIYETKLLPSHYREKIKQVMPEAINKEHYADNSRPDTIAQLVHDGLRCIGADKGKGSVEAGVEWLQGKKIYTHPSCKNTIYELYNYKYKTDKNSGKITTEIIDANNHAMDAIRYGCFKLIAQGKKNISRLFTQSLISRMF